MWSVFNNILLFFLTYTFSSFQVFQKSSIAFQPWRAMFTRMPPRLTNCSTAKCFCTNNSIKLIDTECTSMTSVAWASSVIYWDLFKRHALQKQSANSPVSQWLPEKPYKHAHISGPIHLPLFLQGSIQIAVMKRCIFLLHSTTLIIYEYILCLK